MNHTTGTQGRFLRAFRNRRAVCFGGVLFCAGVATADTIFVAPCGNDAWTGASETCAAPDGPKLTIQAGINAAVNGDEVIVLAGIYDPINLMGKAITLRNNPGDVVTIVGGGTTAVTCNTNEGPDTVIDGFDITSGFSTGGPCPDLTSPAIGGTVGGGIFIDGGANRQCSPTIMNCNINNNRATCRGAGMYIQNCRSDPAAPELQIINCFFFANGRPIYTDLLGGAIAVWRSDIAMTDCHASANVANEAAALYLFESTCRMTNCTFSDNDTSDPDSASVVNQGHLTLLGQDNEIRAHGTDRGYTQCPTSQSRDSGVLAVEVTGGGDVGQMTVIGLDPVKLGGKFEVRFLTDNPPAETDFVLLSPDFPFLDCDGNVDGRFELTEVKDPPDGRTAVANFSGPGSTGFTVKLEDDESILDIGGETSDDDPGGEADAFVFVDLNPANPATDLDDLVVIDGTNVVVHLNVDGNFQPGTMLTSPDVNRVLAADINCDGFPDIIAYNTATNPPSVHLFENDKNEPGGNFTLHTSTCNGCTGPFDSVIPFVRTPTGETGNIGIRCFGVDMDGDAYVTGSDPECVASLSFSQASITKIPINFEGWPPAGSTITIDSVEGTRLDRTSDCEMQPCHDAAAIFVRSASEFAIVALQGPNLVFTSVAHDEADGNATHRAFSADLDRNGEPDYVVATVFDDDADAHRGEIKVILGDGGGSGINGNGIVLTPDLDLIFEDALPVAIDALDLHPEEGKKEGDNDLEIVVGFTTPGDGTTGQVIRTYLGDGDIDSSDYHLTSSAADDETGFNFLNFRYAAVNPGGGLKELVLMNPGSSGATKNPPPAPAGKHAAGPGFGHVVVAHHVGCREDINRDGEVNFVDLLAILGAWGNPGGPEDVDGNGVVGFGDILAILARWGSPPCRR